MTWNERLGADPDLEPEEGTTEEQMERATLDSSEEEMRAERARKLWETYAHYVTAEGRLYGRPEPT